MNVLLPAGNASLRPSRERGGVFLSEKHHASIEAQKLLEAEGILGNVRERVSK